MGRNRDEWVAHGAPHGLGPMQATGSPNRPISAQPEGQRPFRAVCGVATLAHSRAMGCALRLAS
ncbi:MAG: tripartite tricarboxylate transporter substrate binding protein, partial [Burkholderiaceae bacterium]|nr:tripartite tricarboxylate transporter substrate binding protein [Burkholderiaceae bacterium]